MERHIMQFCWVTLNVNNMEKSLWFYRDIVGLPLNRTFSPAPSDQIAFLGSGETQVELIRNEKNAPTPFSQNISLGFKLIRSKKTMEMLKANGIPVHAGPFRRIRASGSSMSSTRTGSGCSL